MPSSPLTCRHFHSERKNRITKTQQDEAKMNRLFLLGFKNAIMPITATNRNSVELVLTIYVSVEKELH